MQAPHVVWRSRAVGALFIVIALLISALGLLAGSPADLPSDADTVRHVLNRVTFGVRPGDIDAVRRLGLGAYLEQQLHPGRIGDRALDDRLAALPTLAMSTRDIVRDFAQPLFNARRDRKAGDVEPKAAASAPAATSATPADADTPPAIDRRLVRAAAQPLQELAQQKVLRAVYSERQLEAVLTDFWFNHFNVDARKSLDRFLLTAYERDVIRPHVLGRFRDLLGATAHSPAMLFYLDNWLSADPGGPHADAAGAGRLSRRDQRRQRVAQRRLTEEQRARLAGLAPKKNGLNENYARELLELHTLGVDGGYTQTDVTEVARVFTGWTIDRPRQGGATFLFDPRLHDPGTKVVLGRTIGGRGQSGEQEGEAVLDLLAGHPATARFIASKLARRFVSDEPPAALVDRLAARFGATDGDLREVMRTLLTSPEFLAPAAAGTKTKTPFEFVVSAVRATGRDIVDARPLVQQVAGLGMPLYQCQPPTGYRDTAEAWTNAGALVQRMNVAQVIAQAEPRSGLRAPDAPDPPAMAGQDGSVIGSLSPSTAAVVAQAQHTWQRLALTLGSPEFQKK